MRCPICGRQFGESALTAHIPSCAGAGRSPAAGGDRGSLVPILFVVLLLLGVLGLFLYNNFVEPGQPAAPSASASDAAPAGAAAPDPDHVPVPPKPVLPRPSGASVREVPQPYLYSATPVVVEGRVTQSFYHAPMAMASSDLEYCVEVTIRNAGSRFLSVDTILARFHSEAGGGPSMRTSRTDESAWDLEPGYSKDFEFCTDGYTSMMLADARGTSIFFQIRLEYGETVVAGPFVAELPPLRSLPSKYDRGGGVALRFFQMRDSSLY